MKFAKIISVVVLAVSAVLATPVAISPYTNALSSAPAPASAEEPSLPEAKAIAMKLASDIMDGMTGIRAMSQSTMHVNRAKDDDDGDDGEISPSKIISQISTAIKPVLKQFSNILSAAVPEGPQRQLVKATSNAINSLLPLILKYAIGL
ncbi:hypothetical protein EC988_005045 [Linderina pennispora]|nr:hypothetical protein EC988_005045 [Linderina pennispora]